MDRQPLPPAHRRALTARGAGPPTPSARRDPEHPPAGAEAATAKPRGRALSVVHVTPAPEFVQKILIHDLRRLRGRVDSTVICAEGPAAAAVRAEGFRVIAVPLRRKITPSADLVALWRLWRMLRRERFDVLHSYVPKGGLLGQLAGALAAVPVRIHSCRGLLYTPGMATWRRWLFRAADRLTSLLAHRTIFISSADMAYATCERLCDPGRARLTGSGIDLAHYSPARLPPDTRERTRASLGVPPDATLVMSAGRFVRDKGYAELAEAAATIARERPNVRFLWVAPVLAGEEGVLPADLRERHGVRDVVLQLPLQLDLAPLYAASDLLVHPSYREGVPRVLMEAAAMGVPIVASDIAGCREVVTDGVSGVLFRARDVAALIAALRQALDDPDAARARAGEAARVVRARFDQDALTERVWGVYCELADARLRSEYRAPLGAPR